METWTATIGALSAIALLILKAYFAKKPERDKRHNDEDIQKGRRDIADGNAAAVSTRIDKLLSVPSEAPGDPARGANNTPGKGDSRTLQRLAALGCGPGETAGEGGSGDEVDRAI